MRQTGVRQTGRAAGGAGGSGVGDEREVGSMVERAQLTHGCFIAVPC